MLDFVCMKGENMKTKLLSLLAASLIISGAVSAEYYAGAGYGVSWNGGHAWTNNIKTDYKRFSGIFSGFLGTVIPTEYLDLRAEGELIHLSAKPDLGRTRKFNALMANLIGVIPNVDALSSLNIKPYVGLGIGYGRWDHRNTFAYQVIGGLEYEFENPVAVALEYKHLWPDQTGGKAYSKSKLNSDTLMLKLKYLF